MSRLKRPNNEACIAAYMPPNPKKHKDHSIISPPKHSKPQKKPRSDLSYLKSPVRFLSFFPPDKTPRISVAEITKRLDLPKKVGE